jgi:uncharacterized protein (TIGR02996 family)
MSIERQFLDEIHAAPYDESPRLVYADWLEERGDPRAEYLRLECELVGLKDDDALFRELAPRLQELREAIDPAWLAEVGRTRIANCLTVAFECPQRWSRLTPMREPKNRFCSACKRTVHYCETLEEARAHARGGHCIALDSTLARHGDAWRFPAEAQRRGVPVNEPEEGEGAEFFETIGFVVEAGSDTNPKRD